MRDLLFAPLNRVLIVSFALFLTLFTTSCGKGSSGKNFQIPGVKGPNITLQQDNMLVSMVFEKIQLQAGLRYEIPKYPNSYVEISPDLQSGGTLMSLSVSLQDVLNGNLDSMDSQRLPGGRALPGVASGALPAVAFTIEKFRGVTFYLGKDVFGFFIPVKINIGNNILTFRHHVGGTRVGNLSIVGPDASGGNSGILLLLDMKGSTKQQLQKIVNKYN